jgi:vacuolar-type H+-ATPase subunit H
MPDLSGLVNELVEATVQAREVIREAHEAIKDLRQAIAEAKRVQPEIFKDWEPKAQELCSRVLDAEFPGIAEAIRETITSAYESTRVCIKCGKIANYRGQDEVCRDCGFEIGKRAALLHRVADSHGGVRV